MGLIKKIKDQIIKLFLGNSTVPRGLFELNQYFRLKGPIKFEKKTEDGLMVAISTNFKYGSIIAQGRDEEELDKNIKDAILTSFEIPSSYAKEAKIVRQDSAQREYAFA